jgi:hypothetical protein
MLDWKRVFNEENRNYANALSDWSLEGNFVYTDLASGTELSVDGNLFSGDRHRIFFDDAAGGGLHGEFYGGRYGGASSDCQGQSWRSPGFKVSRIQGQSRDAVKNIIGQP